MFRVHHMQVSQEITKPVIGPLLYSFIVNIIRIVLSFIMKIKYFYEYCAGLPLSCFTTLAGHKPKLFV